MIVMTALCNCYLEGEADEEGVQYAGEQDVG